MPELKWRRNTFHRNTTQGQIWLDGRGYGGKPIVPPHPADVISCLLIDSSAGDYATFEDWANELGYDADSRKAETIWQACLETSRQMNRVIGHDVIEALRGPCSEL